MEIDLRALRQAQTGDASSFARLVENHYRAVRGLAFSVVGDWCAAEDIAQETFLVAWTRLDSLRAAAAFGGWLRAIVRNLSVSWLRSQGYRDKLIERRAHLVPAPETVANEARGRLDREDRRAEVWRALQTLPQSLREPVALHYVEEKTIAEVADILNISENAVKKRIHRARLRLRDYFEAQWIAELAAERRRDGNRAAERFLAALPLGVVDPLIAQRAATSGWGAFSNAARLLESGLTKAAIGAGLAALAAAWIYWGPTFSSQTTAPIIAKPAPMKSLAGDAKEDAAQTAQRAANADANSSRAPDAKMLTTTSAEKGSPAPHRFIVQVVDDARNPIPGAQVLATVWQGDDFYSKAYSAEQWLRLSARLTDPSLHVRQRVGKDGAFDFEIVPPEGDFRMFFWASAEGYDVDSCVVNCAANANGAQNDDADREHRLSISLDQGDYMTGRVRSLQGAPLKDACVKLVAWIRDGALSKDELCLPNAITDADGIFGLVALPKGRGILRVVSAAKEQQVFVDQSFSEAQPLELRFAPTASLKGRITAADGQPERGARVEFRGSATLHGLDDSDPPESTAQDLVYYETETDAQGAYAIAGLAPGLEYLATLKNAEKKNVARNLYVGTLRAGEARDWDYDLAPTPTVYGVLRGERTGKPLANIPIRWSKLAGAKAQQDRSDFQPTDAEGRFSIALDTGAGDYQVGATYPFHYQRNAGNGFEERYAQRIQAGPGENIEANLTLPEPWSFRLQVVNEQGERQPIIPFIREDYAPIAAGGQSYSASGWNYDSQGWATLNGLPPYIGIQIECSDSATPVLHGKPGETGPDQKLIVYAEKGSAQGIALAPDGAPLKNREMAITIRDSIGSERAFTTVSTDGSFNLSKSIFATRVIFEFFATDDAGRSLRAELGPYEVSPDQTLDLGTVQLFPVSK